MNDTMMKKIKIVDILVGDRHRKDYKNLPELKASITEVILRNGEQMERGLINPIAVMRLESEELPYKLLAGGRRLAACTELEHEFIDAKVFPPMDEYDSKSI